MIVLGRPRSTPEPWGRFVISLLGLLSLACNSDDGAAAERASKAEQASPPRAVVPEADRPPTLWVEVRIDGAAARVDDEVTRPIEDALASLPGLRHITTESTDGWSRIALETERDAVDVAAVTERLALIQSRLARGAAQPLVVVSPATETTTIRWSVHGYEIPAQQLRALHTDLETMPGVRALRPCGYDALEITVQMDAMRAHAYGVDVPTIVAAIEGRGSALADAPPPRRLETLAETIVRPQGPTRLDDVATLRIAPVAATCWARRVDGPVTHGAALVSRQSDAHAAVEARLAAFEAELPPGSFDRFDERAAYEVLAPPTMAMEQVVRRLGEALRPLAGDRAVIVHRRPDAPCDPRAGTVRVLLPGEPVAPDVVRETLAGSGFELISRSDDTLARAWLVGREPDALRSSVAVEAARLTRRPDVVTVWGAGIERGPVLDVEVDRARLAALGLSADDLRAAVEAATHGIEVLALPDSEAPRTVRLRAPGPSPEASVVPDPVAVTSQVLHVGAAEVRLDALVRVRIEDQPTRLCRRDGRPAAQLLLRLADGADRDAVRRAAEAEIAEGIERWDWID